MNLQQKILPLACSLSIILALSACSSTQTMDQLQRDLNKNSQSAYVRDNLKSQPKAKQSNTLQASQILQTAKLKKVQNQLIHKKKSANNRLKSTIGNNGLFVASPSVQRLKGRTAYENTLKKQARLFTVLSIVLKNNLAIKNSFEEAQANLAKYDQVSFLDDMLAQYAVFTKDLSLTGSTQKHNKSVATGFPFPGLMTLKAAIIDQAVETSRLKLKQATQDVISQTQQSYYKLQYNQREITIIQQEVNLLSALKEELNNNYSSNTANLNSVIQVDIEIDKDRNRLQVAKDQKRALQAKLNALMNVSPDLILGKLDLLVPLKMPLNAKQLIKSAKANRVEIALLKSNLQKMAKIIRLSEKRFYPDFDAGFSRFQNKTSKQVGSGAQQPSFNTKPKIKINSYFAKNDAYLIETKQKYKALQFKIKSLETQTADDIQQALSRYQSQQRTFQLYQSKILPKAKEALQVAKNDYEAEGADYIQVLDAQEILLKYRLSSNKALREMNIEVSKIARILGKR
jgi:outer membrane protein TolC